MKDKKGIAATLILWLVCIIIIVSIVVWGRNGFIAFLNYYKDFAANIRVALLTFYLLMVEKKEKQLRKDRAAYQRRTEQIKPLLERGIPQTIDQYKDAAQKETNTAKKHADTKKEKDTITYLLAGFTICSAILALISYLLK